MYLLNMTQLRKIKKEDADYLKHSNESYQLANIKNVWKHKTKKDVNSIR